MPHKLMRCTVFVLATLALIVAVHGGGLSVAGTSTPNVSGTWQGTWTHEIGSGQITLRLAQEGTKVIGEQSLPAVMPVFGDESPRQIRLGTDVREGHLEDSTLIFHVGAPDTPGGRVNFTLTVSGETMTGTACGYTCATLKLKKAAF